MFIYIFMIFTDIQLYSPSTVYTVTAPSLQLDGSGILKVLFLVGHIQCIEHKHQRGSCTIDCLCQWYQISRSSLSLRKRFIDPDHRSFRGRLFPSRPRSSHWHRALRTSTPPSRKLGLIYWQMQKEPEDLEENDYYQWMVALPRVCVAR